MNFDHIISDHTGLIHLIVSIIALLTGTLNLILVKGTLLHKKIGYVYAISMIVLLVTAFMMYNLYGTWGIFHWTAVISTLTLACGLFPILAKRPANNYVVLHFCFMYWSVMGLYGAFVSELFVRLPKIVIEGGILNSTFYLMMNIGIALTMGLGAFFFIKLKPKWDKQFGQNPKIIVE
jgi:uncharacterized membrane protein